MKTLLIALAALCAGCSSDNSTGVERDAAIVHFAFDGHPADTLRVLVTSRATIDAADRYIRTKQGAHIPIGPIVRDPGADARYPFHFLSDSLRLAELAMELCDGAPMRTAAAVTEFIAGATGDANSPRATYCPWGAHPVRIEAAPAAL